MLLFISLSVLLTFILAKILISSTSYYIRYSLTRSNKFLQFKAIYKEILAIDKYKI